MVAEVVTNPPPSEVPTAAKETPEDTANANEDAELKKDEPDFLVEEELDLGESCSCLEGNPRMHRG